MALRARSGVTGRAPAQAKAARKAPPPSRTVATGPRSRPPAGQHFTRQAVNVLWLERTWRRQLSMETLKRYPELMPLLERPEFKAVENELTVPIPVSRPAAPQ